MFTNLYSKFTGGMADEIAPATSNSGSKKNQSKLSPFKKAHDVLKRKFSGNSDNSDEIFNERDCIDPTQVFYRRQIQDTLGKDNIDEKMVALVTGAKEPIKKQRYGSRLGPDGEMNIFEILQMFRDNHGGQRFAGLGADPIHQLLLAAAHGDPENEGSEDELEDDHFGEDGSGFGEYGVENFQAHQEEGKEDERDRRIMGGGLIGTNIIGGRRPAEPRSSPEQREIMPSQLRGMQPSIRSNVREEGENEIRGLREPEGRANREDSRLHPS